MELIVRASESSKMMTNSRSKSEPLSETTLTWLKEKAVEHVLGYRPDITNKYMEKGTTCEDDSIELLNEVLFTNYKKHTGRINTEGFTGECDILEDDHIRDIKTSWSIDTFPFFQDDAEKAVKKSGYDWQVRVYMMLYGVDVAYIDYCLVNTPDDLIGWEDKEKHIVDHIEVTKRVTTVKIERDEAIEKQILERLELCKVKFNEFVNELNEK
jgi:hypothetical protein